jgi:type IV pilus assembly protein PilB
MRAENLLPNNRPRIGEILARRGLVSQSVVRDALTEQKASGQKLGAILVRLQRVSQEDVNSALHEQSGLKVVDLDTTSPSPQVMNLVPLETMRRFQTAPLFFEGGQLVLVSANPLNFDALDNVRYYLRGHRLEVRACTPSKFARFFAVHFDKQNVMEEIQERSDFYKQTIRLLEEESSSKAPIAPEDRDLAAQSEQSPVITLCNYILSEGIGQRASDIHIEPTETAAQVRFRIDGILQIFLTLPRASFNPMVARYKIISNLNIAKTRVPQDGHFNVVHQNKPVHFRISTLPTALGEKVVIRILPQEQGLLTLGALGLEPHELSLFKHALSQPQGLILVTGPTGSGKTTTIHAGLSHINRPEVNIVTLEDPVEATILGINHVGIHPVAGLTFSGVLRSILRQDPDIIFVGEVRDNEVADIALKAALTGHLVMSTLHTNSAVETIMRMEDLGVAPYLLASSLALVISQRLVRKVCERCAAEYTPSDDELIKLGVDKNLLIGARFRKGAGCPHCNNTGYYGRTAIYEFLPMTKELREGVRKGAGLEPLRALARQQGMVNLMESGILKMRRGFTTAQELARVVYREL